MEISDGKHSKGVHINRLQHHCVPGQQDVVLSDKECDSHHLEWSPSVVDHVILPPAEQTEPDCYPQRRRRPPDWYQP